MGDTIQKPGGDSGVVRVHGTEKAVAASVTLQLFIAGHTANWRQTSSG